MTGETIKIGFDGSSVKRGLAGIMGGFGKLGTGIGRVTRQIGIGAARRMGSDLFGLVFRALKALPNELSSLSDLRQEMFALGDATGVTVEQMLALRQAIAKTSNISPKVATKVLREMTGKLGGVQHGDPAFRALRNLGLKARELKGLGAHEQLKKIAHGFQSFAASNGIEEATDAMRDLFGGAGAKITPLLLDWEGSMARATEETKGMAGQMTRMTGALDGLDDIGIAFANKMSEAALGLLEGVDAAGIKTRNIAQWINNLKIADKTKTAADFIAKQMKAIEKDGPLDWIMAKMTELGEWIAKKIGEGIKLGIENSKELIKELMPSINPFKGSGGKMKSMFGFKPDTAGADNSKGIERNTGETNNILRRIADGGSIATYA